MDVSVVIPCYNEEKILVSSILKLEKFFFKNRRMFNYELIFVNDGSEDNTQNILDTLKKHTAHFVVASNGRNRGKGFSVRRGILLAKYDNVVVLDADLSVRPKNILKIREKLKPSITYGNRIQVVKQPFYRVFVGKVFSVLVGILFLRKPTDTQCPMKFLQNVDKEIIKLLKVDGFAYDVELLKIADRTRIPVNFVDVEYINNEDSTVTFLKTLRMLFDIIKIRIK